MKRKLKGGIVGMILAIAAVLGMAATPASAASLSYLYNGGGSVPVYYAPNTQYSNVKVWAPSGTTLRGPSWSMQTPATRLNGA